MSIEIDERALVKWTIRSFLLVILLSLILVGIAAFNFGFLQCQKGYLKAFHEDFIESQKPEPVKQPVKPAPKAPKSTNSSY
jgi:hypothetical protein